MSNDSDEVRLNQCQAIARSTKRRCEKEALPAKKYCFSHRHLETEPTSHSPRMVLANGWRIGRVLLSIIGIATSLYALAEILDFYSVIRIRQPVSKMTGEFNIAVAEFSTVDGHNSTLGNEIASVFYKRLQADLNAFVAESNQVKVFEILPPDIIGTIRGATPEEREQSASELAEKLNAHVVIYGTVDEVERDVLIAPDFFVSMKYFIDAEELLGRHRFGALKSLKHFENNYSNRLEFNTELANRSTALSMVTIGIAHHFQKDYQTAQRFYKNAENSLSSSSGREVLYVLMGNAAIKEEGGLDQAQDYYLKAINVNPDYARGYIGLATSSFRFAISNKGRVDYDQVRKTIDYYNQALACSDKPQTANIEYKAHFGLGESELLLSQASQANLLSEARENFQFVIDYYDLSPSEFLWERAAQANAHQGLIAYIQIKGMDEVKEFYEKAVAIAMNYDTELASSYYERLAVLYQQRGDIPIAKSFYLKAKETTELAVQKDRIQKEIDVLPTVPIETVPADRNSDAIKKGKQG
jgi:tetratricopeptide (TPR) repeat protein